MKNVSLVLLLLAAMVTTESSAGLKHFLRHPKDLVRQPKKFVTAVVRTVENGVLEPVAHAVENEVIEPAANGVNDHVIKPFFRGFKRKIEQHSEQDGELAADVAHEVVVATLTGKAGQGTSTAPQACPVQKSEGEKPAKRQHN